MLNALESYKNEVEIKAVNIAYKRLEQAKNICESQFDNIEPLMVIEVAKLLQQAAKWLTDD